MVVGIPKSKTVIFSESQKLYKYFTSEQRDKTVLAKKIIIINNNSSKWVKAKPEVLNECETDSFMEHLMKNKKGESQYSKFTGYLLPSL